jgi:N-acyl-D-aspartate/D-glutamate deacylase
MASVERAADLVLFDYNKIASCERPEMPHDLPGGCHHLIVRAQGINYTIINGEILYDNGKHSGRLPGRVLHSGAMVVS